LAVGLQLHPHTIRTEEAHFELTFITDPFRLGLSGSFERSIVIRGTSRLTLSLQKHNKVNSLTAMVKLKPISQQKHVEQICIVGGGHMSLNN